MDDPGITPTPPQDPDIRWLLAQHEHDLEALERAADLIAIRDARIRRLEADQTALILESRRQERTR